MVETHQEYLVLLVVCQSPWTGMRPDTPRASGGTMQSQPAACESSPSLETWVPVSHEACHGHLAGWGCSPVDWKLVDGKSWTVEQGPGLLSWWLGESRNGNATPPRACRAAAQAHGHSQLAARASCVPCTRSGHHSGYTSHKRAAHDRI